MFFAHAWLQSLHHRDCTSPWTTLFTWSPTPDCKPEGFLRAGLVLSSFNLFALWQGPGLEKSSNHWCGIRTLANGHRLSQLLSILCPLPQVLLSLRL